MKSVPLLGILLVAWALILAESYLFFGVIITLGPGIHSVGAFALSTLLKIGLTFCLAIVWFAVNIFLTRTYMRSRLRRLPPSASS